MRRAAWYLKAAAMLPLATWNYLRKNRGWGLLVASLVLILFFALMIGTRLHGNQNEEIIVASVQEGADSVQSAEEAPVLVSEPAATMPPTCLVTLTFAGDCTLGMDDYLGYADSFNEAFDREGPDYFLQAVKPLFEEDDLTVVNFEGPLTEGTEKADKSFAFKGHAEFAEVLSAGSVEVADLANNHSRDYGDQGFLDTERALDQEGVTHFGFEDVALVEVSGVKVGFTGLFTVYENPEHLENLQINIQKLKEQDAQVIVACFHWGFENDYTPEPDQIELAHAAIDAGAHLVIGHHPHVLQGVEIYNGRYIVYSLGNFCFSGGNGRIHQTQTVFRLILSVSLRADGFLFLFFSLLKFA